MYTDDISKKTITLFVVLKTYLRFEVWHEKPFDKDIFNLTSYILLLIDYFNNFTVTNNNKNVI